MHLPQLTLDDYNHQFADRHLLHGVVAKWARERPEAIALAERRNRPRGYMERV